VAASLSAHSPIEACRGEALLASATRSLAPVPSVPHDPRYHTGASRSQDDPRGARPFSVAHCVFDESHHSLAIVGETCRIFLVAHAQTRMRFRQRDPEPDSMLGRSH